MWSAAVLVVGTILSLTWCPVQGLTPGQVTRSSSDTVDVVFLLDHTGTVNETEFDYQKNFVNAFVDAVPFGRNDYRIAVLSWNSAGNEHVLLNELFNATLFKEQVEMIAYAPVGIPDLALGLQRMKEVFRTGYGARSYATHVGIVLIDGPANPGYQVAAGLLEDEDVLLIGVALDSHATATAVLNEIISNPDRILGEEFALLDTRVSDIIALIRECTVDCGGLDITNGMISYSQETRVNSMATYSCFRGYNLTTGDGVRTCEVSGAWNGTAPVCQLVDCGSPPEITNGSVDTSGGSSYKCTVVYSCSVGYVLNGALTSTCQESGSWSGPTPTCQVVDCGPLSGIDNGAVQVSMGTVYQSEAMYSCNHGYQLSASGHERRTCGSNGVWNGTSPICQVVDCGMLDAVENGYIVYTMGTVHQSQAMYACNHGYNLTGGDTRTCGADGSWNGTAPMCQIVDCGSPPEITNGSVDTSGGSSYKCTVVYSCSVGYVLNGALTSTCQESGSWSGPTPTCQVVDCGPLSGIDNGAVQVSMGTVYQSEAMYSCNHGYQLSASGHERRTCGSNGVWNGTSPICQVVDCGVLDAVENGYIVYTMGTVHQSQAMYACNHGYNLTGGDTRTCGADESWDGASPMCQIVDCGSPPEVTNGSVDTSGGSSYKCTVVYSCSVGYVLNGALTSTCQESGSWSGPTPTCQVVDCGPLSEIDNGAVQVSMGTVYQSEAMYSCNHGYQLSASGHERRTCRSNGVWNGTSPICQVVDCGVLDAVENGYIVYTMGTVHQSQAMYACNHGYNLTGGDTRTCGTDGSWDGTSPMCQIVDCGSPPEITNGSVDTSGGSSYKCTVVYSCSVGYVLNGALTSTCQESGSWSGPTPTCQVVDCGPLSEIDNGAVQVSMETVYQSEAMYSCNHGYQLSASGHERRTCGSNGVWNGTSPICQVVDCGVLDAVENGYIVYTMGTVHQSQAMYACNHGYNLTGGDTRTCGADESWDGASPMCQIVDCGSPPEITNGSVDTSGGSSYKCTVVYSCSVGYVLNGALTSTCQESGSWSGPTPTCQVVDCGPLSEIDNGAVQVSMGTVYQSEAMYSCNHGYQLSASGHERRTCGSNGVWNGTSRICQVVDCGVLDAVENGYIVYTMGTVHQSQAMYACNHGYNLTGEDTRTCGAAGSWDGTSPMCQIVDCGSPPEITNGSVDTSGGSSYKCTVVYSCSVGYVLNGALTSTCQESGSWSGPTPTCQVRDCGPVDDPDNGMAVFTTTTFNSTVLYTCNPGYQLFGMEMRTCTESGVWTGGEPSCHIVDCGVLDAVENGYIVYTMGTVHQSQAMYACNHGYNLTGGDTRTCGADESWDGTSPMCQIVDCGTPTSIANGLVDVSRGTSFDSLGVYSCLDGYMLDGGSVVTCQGDGSWSGPLPNCSIVDCGPLIPPINGRVDTPSGTTYSAVANYSCADGYQLVGTAMRTCQGNRQWNHESPVCEAVDCRGLLAVRDADVIYSTGTSYQAVAEVTCHTGYRLNVSPYLVCQADGNWIGVAKDCQIVDCGPPPQPTNGSAVTSTDTSYKSLSLYSCDIGFNLVGKSLRTCLENGSWSGPDPHCEIVECGPPPNITNGQVAYTNITYLSAAEYSCSVGYNLVGPSTRLCRHTGEWMKTDTACSIVDCGYPAPVLNANINFSNGTVYLSRAIYICQVNHELIGDQERMCQANGTWSGTDPSCIIPLPPVSVSATALNRSTIFLEWEYDRNISRPCEVVVLSQDGSVVVYPLGVGNTSAVIELVGSGLFTFRARCNSTIGTTNFSQPVTLEVASDDPCFNRNDIFCQPSLVAAIVAPVLIVVALLIVGGVILSLWLVKKGQKEELFSNKNGDSSSDYSVKDDTEITVNKNVQETAT